jgi:hypothetical protein
VRGNARRIGRMPTSQVRKPPVHVTRSLRVAARVTPSGSTGINARRDVNRADRGRLFFDRVNATVGISAASSGGGARTPRIAWTSKRGPQPPFVNERLTGQDWLRPENRNLVTMAIHHGLDLRQHRRIVDHGRPLAALHACARAAPLGRSEAESPSYDRFMPVRGLRRRRSRGAAARPLSPQGLRDRRSSRGPCGPCRRRSPSWCRAGSCRSGSWAGAAPPRPA